VGGSFAISYGTGADKGQYQGAVLVYVMGISMFQVPAVQFGVASHSNFSFSSVLDLGYTFPYSIPYPSLLNLMVSQRLIAALCLAWDWEGSLMVLVRSSLGE
jgi:hypothetical protein